jgi:ubiquinol-cytochrome c reductase cytochrome b subunit
VRTAEGRFFEVHEPLTEEERWTLVQHETLTPVRLTRTVDANGVRRKSTLGERLRAKISSFYFSDGVHPVTPAELAAAHHDGAGHEAIENAEEPYLERPPAWVGQLHGGADERPETDAYAGPSHPDGPDGGPDSTR